MQLLQHAVKRPRFDLAMPNRGEPATNPQPPVAALAMRRVKAVFLAGFPGIPPCTSDEFRRIRGFSFAPLGANITAGADGRVLCVRNEDKNFRIESRLESTEIALKWLDVNQ